MSKIQSFFHRIKQSFSPLSTPAAIIIAAVLVSGSHIAYAFILQGESQTQVAYFAGRPVDNTDFVEGATDSDVIIMEYSDPECPYCITLHPTMKQLRTDYGDKVAFVYRHFPLTQIHPHAFDESKAIACAGTLGGTKTFYEYVDKLYGFKSETQNTQLPETGKDDIAKHVGLDQQAFTACMQNENTDLTVQASLNDGSQAGVQGTPSTFILEKTRKGYKIVAMIDGARQYEYFKAALDQALGE